MPHRSWTSERILSGRFCTAQRGEEGYFFSDTEVMVNASRPVPL